jgi:hypothetical protein
MVVEESMIDLSAARLALTDIPLGSAALVTVLTGVARLAAGSIPEAVGASICLVEVGRAAVIAVSAEFVQDLERWQQELGEGPAATALLEGASAGSGSLGGERRWPRFGPRAGRAGIHSALSLPLGAELPLGAITLYSKTKSAFGAATTRAAESFAEAAAVVVRNAHMLDRAGRLVTTAQWAVNEGAIVQRAVGILMSRRGVDAEDALKILRELSQRQNVKLVELAAEIVNEAVNRVRGRPG